MNKNNLTCLMQLIIFTVAWVNTAGTGKVGRTSGGSLLSVRHSTIHWNDEFWSCNTSIQAKILIKSSII
jgi:hypothetical protein